MLGLRAPGRRGTDKPAAVSSGPKSTGSWDSIHVFEAIDGARTCHYKLTSTVILNMVSSGEGLGEMDLSGNMTRQVENDLPVEETPAGSERDHISNIGKLVEEMELKMRNLLRMFLSSSLHPFVRETDDEGQNIEEVYFGKAKDVVADLRSVPTLSQTNRDRAMQQEMISSMSKR